MVDGFPPLATSYFGFGGRRKRGPKAGAKTFSSFDDRRKGLSLEGVRDSGHQHAPSLFWVTSATSLGFVVVQLDVTIVNVALPRIGQSLHSEVSGLQWVVDAYTLALAVFMLSAGVAGDLWGARRTFVAGFI